MPEKWLVALTFVGATTYLVLDLARKLGRSGDAGVDTRGARPRPAASDRSSRARAPHAHPMSAQEQRKRGW